MWIFNFIELIVGFYFDLERKRKKMREITRERDEKLEWGMEKERESFISYIK